MMKKTLCLSLLILAIVFVPFNVHAESINDLRARISKLEGEKSANDAKAAEVQKKMDAARAELNEISRKIAEVIKEQDATKEEIKELEKKIDEKNEEIKDLVAFYQISDNDNFYLKFIFGADSFEDFIYRFSVAEQLTDANDKLVDEMNGLIKENEEKVKQLEAKQKELNELDRQAALKLEQLGDEKEGLVEFNMTTDDKIAVLEKQIAAYKKMGCSASENCTGRRNIPNSSGFIRPTSYGRIDNDGLSAFGYRWHPVTGAYTFHEGVDITISYGEPVFAVAAGTVEYTDVWGAGGNTVIIYHNVNGYAYSTFYLHLSSFNVNVGDTVTQGQQIGRVGSTGRSTGPHLHFQMISGHGTYYSHSQLIDPMNKIPFPNLGVWW